MLRQNPSIFLQVEAAQQVEAQQIEFARHIGQQVRVPSVLQALVFQQVAIQVWGVLKAELALQVEVALQEEEADVKVEAFYFQSLVLAAFLEYNFSGFSLQVGTLIDTTYPRSISA